MSISPSISPTRLIDCPQHGAVARRLQDSAAAIKGARARAADIQPAKIYPLELYAARRFWYSGGSVVQGFRTQSSARQESSAACRASVEGRYVPMITSRTRVGNLLLAALPL